VDLTPWQSSRDFRLLLLAGTVFYLGGMVSYVAVPYQLYTLTGSNFAVGAMGLVELVPLVVFGLWGGAIADHYDRRTVLVTTGAGQVLLTAGLLLNAALPHPKVWALYVIGGLLSAAQSLQRPSREALVPRVVRHDELPAAVALSTFGMQIGWVAGPALGGVILARAGAAWAFGVNVSGLVIATALFAALRPAPPLERSSPPSIAGIVEGLRYAVGRRDLLGTYVVDIICMFMAMSETIFPALAQGVFRQPELLGLLYSAPMVGGILVTVTSGWVRRVQHHGRAVVIGATGWGVGMTLTGLAPSIWLALPCLALAGASDMVSGLFRGTIWNQTIPDDKRGRLAGIEMLSYSVGPLGGQVRAGLTADRFGVRQAVVSGGLLCVVGVALTATWLGSFWAYDARTDVHAVRERTLREERQAVDDAAPA
jgi:MFS family permease